MIGWEDLSQDDLYCVKRDVKPYYISITIIPEWIDQVATQVTGTRYTPAGGPWRQSVGCFSLVTDAVVLTYCEQISLLNLPGGTILPSFQFQKWYIEACQLPVRRP